MRINAIKRVMFNLHEKKKKIQQEIYWKNPWSIDGSQTVIRIMPNQRFTKYTLKILAIPRNLPGFFVLQNSTH